MNNRPKIVVNAKPTLDQLKSWFEEGREVDFTEQNDIIGNITHHNGKINLFTPMGDDALLWVENSRFGVYLRNIYSYSFTPDVEPIFIPAESTSPDKVILKVGDKTFTVNKFILSKRVDYFRAMFNNCMKESKQELIDLSEHCSVEELEALLLVVNAGNSKLLNYEQTQLYFSAAHKVAEIKMITDAESRMNEHLEIINRLFLKAVIAKKYVDMPSLLLKGSGINQKFGKYANAKCDGYVYDCPNDTPLTYAARTNDLQLTTFLLENGANTEAIYMGDTPLSNACFNHKVEMVALLLKYKANPNNKDPMLYVFLGMRDWLLKWQEKSAKEIVKLLLDNQHAGKPNLIVDRLKKSGYSKDIINIFIKLWEDQKSSIDLAYTGGAAAGAFNEILPPETGTHIGRFLARKTGGQLAQVSKAAAITSKQKEQMKIDVIQTNIKLKK